MKPLTSSMKKALIQVGFGVRKYRNNKFYEIDDPETSVDCRSLEALARRNLIYWFGAGGVTHQIHLRLTEEGEKLFEEIRSRR